VVANAAIRLPNRRQALRQYAEIGMKRNFCGKKAKEVSVQCLPGVWRELQQHWVCIANGEEQLKLRKW
jgi:hypothetical protein